MAAATSRKGLLICSDTYNAAKSSSTLAFEKQEPFKVKGKANPITTWVPSKAKKKANDSSPSTVLTNIIGRDKEIENMQELANSIIADKKKHPHILLIEGEIGVGNQYIESLFYFIINFVLFLQKAKLFLLRN